MSLAEIVIKSAIALILVGGLVGVIIGLGLILAPRKIFVLNRKLNEPLHHSKGVNYVLSHQVIVDSFFYKHRFVTATLFFLFSLFVAYWVTFVFHFKRSVNFLNFGSGSQVHFQLVEIWLMTVVLILGITALFTFILTILLLFFPNKVKMLGDRLNTAHSAESLIEPLEKAYYFTDRWVFAYPRVSGAILCIGSSFILFVFMHRMVI